MLFLDFLWIFVFIVFLNARPIFKSMTNNFIAGNNVPMPHNIELMKRNQDYNNLKSNGKHTRRLEIKSLPIRVNKNNLKFKRKIACKKTNFNDFDKYEPTKCYGKYCDIFTAYKEVTNNTSDIFKSIETDKLKKDFNYNELISTTPTLPEFTILENSNNFFDLSSPRSTNDDTEFLGTAEIEAVLNEIKHREIQMIAGHEPSLSNLITNSIIETTYSSILDLKAYSNGNKYTTTRSIKKTKKKSLNHLFQRSIKEECSTLAQNIENKLQKKIKNVFKKVKNKISHDYNKEIKKTKEATKQKYEKITNKICNSTKTPDKDLKRIQPTKFTQKDPSNTTLANSRNSHSTTKCTPLQKVCKNSSPPNHTIPILGDEFSMLTIFEQLLSKGQENSIINTLTTKKKSIKKVERSSRHNQNNRNNNQEIFDILEYPNTDLDKENKIVFLETVTTNSYEQNDQSDATTEDTSFEALSNKLSYNDYVNGYKYYLNYQKEQDDNKFSNLIRYQAHKHHNVDDIGKFILNKIPQLPTKIYKRHFVESETLDDQDVSTKSEDSWFKKHFFLFLDTDPPKQFHSTQTVTCKNNKLQKDNNIVLRNNTYLHKRYIHKREDLKGIRHKYHNSFVLSNSKFISPINEDTTLHTRSTAIVKLQKKKDKKRIRTFQIFHRKPKQKHKREDRFRVQRFDIFKGVKDILKYQPKYFHTRQEKLFDYEIMSSPQPYDHFNIKKLYNVHEMMKQVPNISANFEFPFPVLDLKYSKLNEDFLKYTKDSTQELPFQNKPDDQQKPIVDCAQRSFWVSTGKQNQLHPFKLTTPISYKSDNNRNIQITNDDVINVHLKTDLSQENYIDPVTFSTIYYKNIKDDNINSNYRMKLTSPKIQKSNYMNSNIHVDNIMFKKSDPLFNMKVESNPLKDSDLAGRVTETYHNNFITIVSVHKLDEKDISLKNNYKKSSNTILRNDYNFAGSKKSTCKPQYVFGNDPTKTIQKNIKTKSKNKSIENVKKHSHMNGEYNNAKYEFEKLNNKNYVNRYYSSTPTTNLVVNKVNKSNLIDTSTNTGGRFYSMYLMKTTKSARSMDKSLLELGNNLYENNDASSNGDSVINKNYNSNKTFLENFNVQPKQYFMTPLPMKIDDFNIFLKNHEIDVESVTAPLRHPVPFSVSDKWKLNKKYVPKSLNETFLLEGYKSKKGKDLKLDTNVKFTDYDIENVMEERNVGPKYKEIKDKIINRDPFRFTHMNAIHYLYNQDYTKTTKALRNPKRLRLCGHNYKYDIIFHSPSKIQDDNMFKYGMDAAYKNLNKEISLMEDKIVGKRLKRNQRYQNDKPEVNCASVENQVLSTGDYEKYQQTKNYPAKLDETHIGTMITDKFSTDVKEDHHKGETSQFFTAKHVAALEVVVDLLKETQPFEEKLPMTLNDNINTLYKPLQKDYLATNAIQLHISIPSNFTDNKRSLEPMRVRKIFSAIMSTPVDLEYQIYSFTNSTNTPTTLSQNIISPGLYLLVENTNLTVPKGNFILKPLKYSLKDSNLIRITTQSMMPQITSELITTVKNNLTKLFSSSPCDYKIKRSTNAKDKEEKNCMNVTNCQSLRVKQNIKRSFHLNSIKKFFGHDRVCNCHCKPNKTMCKPCAACDAVISEIMFELDNLAKYMTDHCTEIQTFFWMNPNGGKKMIDTVHRFDTTLNDYYKRVKGKCQGRTCQMISSNIDKRSLNDSNLNNEFLKKMDDLVNNLDNVTKLHNIVDENIYLSGKNCLNVLKTCLGRKHKKSLLHDDIKQTDMKNMYSLDSIKINLICKKNNTKTTDYYTVRDLENITSTTMVLYYDPGSKETQYKIRKYLKKKFMLYPKKKYQYLDKSIPTTNQNILNIIKNEQALVTKEIGSPRKRKRNMKTKKTNIKMTTTKGKDVLNKLDFYESPKTLSSYSKETTDPIVFDSSELPSTENILIEKYNNDNDIDVKDETIIILNVKSPVTSGYLKKKRKINFKRGNFYETKTTTNKRKRSNYLMDSFDFNDNDLQLRTQSTTRTGHGQESFAYGDYDIVKNVKKLLNNTGIINKMANKFKIKIVPDTKSKKKAINKIMKTTNTKENSKCIYIGWRKNKKEKEKFSTLTRTRTNSSDTTETTKININKKVLKDQKKISASTKMQLNSTVSNDMKGFSRDSI